MTGTVGELFPEPDHVPVHAWLWLKWGSRKETPVQVAERMLLMLPVRVMPDVQVLDGPGPQTGLKENHGGN